MNKNTRFKEIAPGVMAELMSPTTTTFFNPEDGSLATVHHASWYLSTGDGTYRKLDGDECTVQYRLDQVEDKCYGLGLIDPVTGIDLSNISAAGYALLGKAMFDGEANNPSDAPVPDGEEIVQTP